jgi:hypothetical protein
VQLLKQILQVEKAVDHGWMIEIQQQLVEQLPEGNHFVLESV